MNRHIDILMERIMLLNRIVEFSTFSYSKVHLIL